MYIEIRAESKKISKKFETFYSDFFPQNKTRTVYSEYSPMNEAKL